MEGPAIVFALFVVAAIVFAVFHARAERLRRAGLRACARARDWDYDEAGGDPDLDPYSHFEVFQQGEDRRLSNTLTGELTAHGRRLAGIGGDHHYEVTTGTGQDRSTTEYDFSYLIVRLPVATTPDLLIRREGLLDKLAGAFGFDDIDFESAEFSRRFHVQSADKRFAYDVVHPRMIELFLASELPVIRIHEGHVLFGDGDAGARWDPATFGRNLDLAQRFFELWPEHLLIALEARA
jgi:hypothetical protein